MGSTKNAISALIADKNIPDDELVKLIKSFFIVQLLRYKNRKAGGLTARMIALANGSGADLLDDKAVFDQLKQFNTGESYDAFKARILALCSETKSGITGAATGLTTKELKNFFFEIVTTSNYLKSTGTDCNSIFQGVDEQAEMKAIVAPMRVKYQNENLDKVIDIIINPMILGRSLPKTDLHMNANNKKDVKSTLNNRISQIVESYLSSANKDGKTVMDFAAAKGKNATAEFLYSLTPGGAANLAVRGASNSIRNNMNRNPNSYEQNAAVKGAANSIRYNAKRNPEEYRNASAAAAGGSRRRKTRRRRH